MQGRGFTSHAPEHPPSAATLFRKIPNPLSNLESRIIRLGSTPTFRNLQCTWICQGKSPDQRCQLRRHSHGVQRLTGAVRMLFIVQGGCPRGRSGKAQTYQNPQSQCILGNRPHEQEEVSKVPSPGHKEWDHHEAWGSAGASPSGRGPAFVYSGRAWSAEFPSSAGQGAGPS